MRREKERKERERTGCSERGPEKEARRVDHQLTGCKVKGRGSIGSGGGDRRVPKLPDKVLDTKKISYHLLIHSCNQIQFEALFLPELFCGTPLPSCSFFFFFQKLLAYNP